MSSMKPILFSGMSGRFKNNLCSHQRLSVNGNTTFVVQGIAQSILSMQRTRTGSLNSVNLENSFLINFKNNFVLTGRTYTAQQRSVFIWEIPMCVYVFIAQSCPTLCNPIDCSPQGPSVHWILQARTLEWVAISFFKRNYRKKESDVAQLCLTLCNPMDCSLPGSSIHGIFQARVLEWVAISFSGKFLCSRINNHSGVGESLLF